MDLKTKLYNMKSGLVIQINRRRQTIFRLKHILDNTPMTHKHMVEFDNLRNKLNNDYYWDIEQKGIEFCADCAHRATQLEADFKVLLAKADEEIKKHKCYIQEEEEPYGEEDEALKYIDNNMM